MENTSQSNNFLEESEMSEFDTELNCEGLNCPLPILKTKKTIDGMSSGPAPEDDCY